MQYAAINASYTAQTMAYITQQTQADASATAPAKRAR
jgi:hypothetical protein